MSTQTEITRIQTARNTIRNKLVGLGLAASTDKLDKLATTVDGITDNGAVDVEVKEGETYTIPKGYHNGSGTVSGVAGGGNYALQSKTVIPTKAQQNIVPDAGKYGLSGVTVEAIPENYQDVTAVDATAADVLANKKIVAADGTIVAGTMPNNGNIIKSMTPADGNFTIPVGYHNGLGAVGVASEDKTVTPTKEEQVLTATTKYMKKVTVAPIPDAYQDVTEVDATADKVLTGSKFVDAEGNVVEGTMVDHSSEPAKVTLDTTNTSYDIPAGYHDGEGEVYISLEEKSATPTKSAQTITPTAGRVLSKVTVAAIPANYQDITVTTAEAAHVLDDKKFVSSTGVVTEGTMANNGDVSASMDGLTQASVTIPAGYTSGGTISLTSDIEDALAQI
jgi:hypothetical protein